MSPPRWPFAFRGLIPLLGLLGVLVFGLSRFAHRWIERSVLENVTSALAAAGHGWARIDLSGQRVRLSGSPPTMAAADAAVSAAREARCPTWLGSRVCAVSVFGEYEASEATWMDMAASIEEGVLTLSGEMPSGQARDALVSFARGVLPQDSAVELVDRLTVAERAAPRGFDGLAQSVARLASLCLTGRATLTAGTVSVACTVARAEESQIRTLLAPLASSGSLGSVELVVSDDVALCERQLADLLTGARIEFATGSATLAASAGPLLDRIAGVADRCPGTLRVEGHTDSTGNPEANQALSQARAEAVLSALASRGIERDRLQAIGYGQANPVDDNATAEGRARNRRIEIHVAPAGN